MFCLAVKPIFACRLLLYISTIALRPSRTAFAFASSATPPKFCLRDGEPVPVSLNHSSLEAVDLD